MPRPMLYATPRKQDVQASIDACLANGDRLMDDAIQLEFREEGGTRLAICMLAQEEYAKAFLLYLVREELVPWDADLWRVMRNHTCKHLIAVILEYIDPKWETVEELQAIIRAEYDLNGAFPPRVRTALNILYFDKIRRGYSVLEELDHEQDIVEIASGERDREKQDSFYVDVDKSCRIKSTPVKRITSEIGLHPVSLTPA